MTGAELKSWYDIYCQIGGYPSVVREYLNSKSIERARSELIRIIDTFMNESIRYLQMFLTLRYLRIFFFQFAGYLAEKKRDLKKIVSVKNFKNW